MGKSNKLVQLFVIATTAYSLYKVVSDFLATDTGQVVKERAMDYFEMAKDGLSDAMSQAEPVVKEVAKKVNENK